MFYLIVAGTSQAGKKWSLEDEDEEEEAEPEPEPEPDAEVDADADDSISHMDQTPEDDVDPLDAFMEV